MIELVRKLVEKIKNIDWKRVKKFVIKNDINIAAIISLSIFIILVSSFIIKVVSDGNERDRIREENKKIVKLKNECDFTCGIYGIDRVYRNKCYCNIDKLF